MQLTLWTYEGPPHVGAMRIATAMEGVHYVLHAPQGDTYADLLFTMIERLQKRPPVTYTTFQARDLGGDTAELFKTAARQAFERFAPQAMLVGSSCTAELIQDDPGGLCKALNLPVPVVALELPSYQRKENWGASETFYQLVRHLSQPRSQAPQAVRVPSCNILGPSALGFRHRDDLAEIRKLLTDMGIAINVVAPQSATPADLARLADADFNVVLYPEIARLSAQWLERNYGQPFTKTIPIGVGATRAFVREVAGLAGLDPEAALAKVNSRAQWYARSVDSTYLTGKRVFVFGDATHAVAAAKVAAETAARHRAAVLQVMLDNIRHGICYYGPDRRVIAANALAARLGGHVPGELVPGVLLDDPVGVPVGVCVCVGGAVALPLWLTLPVLEGDAPAVRLAVGDRVALELALSVLLGVCEKSSRCGPCAADFAPQTTPPSRPLFWCFRARG
jgi:light-independent protochlorophyllide reductase B subunit